MANLKIFSKNQKKDREIGRCVRVGRESSRQTGRQNSRPTARPCLSGEGGDTAIAAPPSDAKKARPTAKANENGRWSG